MLTPRQITAIKRLHWVNRWPLRQIERHLRISRKTIRKYILESSPCRLRRGRASKLDPHKSKVLELLQQDPTLKPRLILPRIQALGYSGGITILRDYLRTVRTKPSGPPMAGSRQEAFEWMRALLQGAIPQSHVRNELKEVGELDKLLAAVSEGRLSVRNKAMAVLARARGVRQSYVCSFLYLGNRTATRYWKDYQRPTEIQRQPNPGSGIRIATFASFCARNQSLDLAIHGSADGPTKSRAVSLQGRNPKHHKASWL